MRPLPETIQELTQLVTDLVGENDLENEKDYRYVLYVRKSTDEQGKQYRSLGDQKAECLEWAESVGLKVAEVIEEAESAKESGIRPKFESMLKNIGQGKFDGILAWHPDRLARNMKDAGTIIDMLDRNIIKDIKFKSFSFEKTTSGKMLLGLAFVLAKEYTDKLSDDVKRGNRRNVLEGKVNAKAKHGYYKDRNKYSRPDGENFKLMKRAWGMRLEGKNLDEIADYLNTSGYSRAKGTGNDIHEPTKMDKKRLSDIFRNPFYAGVMNASGKVVNLIAVYNFIPLVSPRDFCAINKINKIGKAFALNKRINRGIVRAKLLRGKVICGECGKKMMAGITNKKEKNGKVRRYFYYRCETKKCLFHSKSVRAKVIRDFAIDFLNKNKFTTKENYEHYVAEMGRVKEIKNKEITQALMMLKARIRDLEKRKQQIKDYLLESEDILIKKDYESDYKVNEVENKKIEKEVKRLEKLLKNNGGVILTYEKFIELFDNLPIELAKEQKIEWLDDVLGKIFLNFTIKEKKVSDFTLNSPFKEFIKNGFVRSGESKRTRTSDLFDVNEAL